VKIVTEHVFPPIPDRSCDWSAIDDDTYDGTEDSRCPIGRGATEAAAIADLMEQVGTPLTCVRCGMERDHERPDGCRDPACPKEAA
jgi:hypothetical protein